MEGSLIQLYKIVDNKRVFQGYLKDPPYTIATQNILAGKEAPENQDLQVINLASYPIEEIQEYSDEIMPKRIKVSSTMSNLRSQLEQMPLTSTPKTTKAAIEILQRVEKMPQTVNPDRGKEFLNKHFYVKWTVDNALAVVKEFL